MAAQQCLVIGDSLTKEYEAEFPALFPSNPASWSARNWIEILHQRRTDWFDTGRWSTFADPRLTGHEHNWAFPGATTTEIKNQLNNFFNFWWTNELKGQLQNAVERMVIFAGGNDVDSYYGNIYNGAAAATYTNATRDNLQWIVDYVRAVKPSLPIVLISVPHLGCAPDVQLQHPTDPIKTARVTAALDALNAQLATFAQLRGIGFVPGVYEFTKAMITEPFRIGGIEFYKQADMNARSRYLFSGDGFHPGTSAHAKIAQLVIETFRSKYPATLISPLGDKEIIVNILGLDPDIPFQEWIANQGVAINQRGLTDDPDGDGLVNAVEFSLIGQGANSRDTMPLPVPILVEGQRYLTWSYHPDSLASEWAVLQAQQSTNLINWTDVPGAQRSVQPDGTVILQVPAPDSVFLRLAVFR